MIHKNLKETFPRMKPFELSEKTFDVLTSLSGTIVTYLLSSYGREKLAVIVIDCVNALGPSVSNRELLFYANALVPNVLIFYVSMIS